jgi:cytochrome P450
VPSKAAGRPCLVITTYAALREFFAAQQMFPGGVVYEFTTAPHIGRTFISMDGPDHDAYRQLAMPAFRSRATARFIDRELTPLAHELIDRFNARGHGDLATEFAQVLPYWSISRKLGLPLGSEDRQRRWAADLLNFPNDPDGARTAADEVGAFLAPIVEARRRDPQDDVISHLLSGDYHGVRFTDDEVFAHVRLLYAVGATTTSDGLSSLLRTVLRDPALLNRARKNPACLPQIVQESLRYEPPVALLPRFAATAGTVAGVDIPAGTPILCGIASANRDPAVFAHPDRFDPDRAETEILTFGFGSKYCPGSHLARQQMLAALAALLERLPELRLVDASEPVNGVLRRVEHIAAAWAA